MHKRFTFFLKYYFPAVIWAGVVFYFSSIPSLQFALPSTAEEIILRKGAHFVEFAILAILLWRAFYGGYKFYPRYAFWWVFILAALYGASDEFHQTFVVGRTGKVIDAIYDAASILFMVEILVVAACRKIIWKNVAILFLALALLVGLEFKMISETKSFSVSLEKIKTELRYTLEHEWDYLRGIKSAAEKVGGKNENINVTGEEKLSDTIQEKIAEVPSVTEKNINAAEPVPVAAPLPEKIAIKVPFATQAPLDQWDAVHEEACEEASLVMLKYYLDGKSLTPALAEKEIQNMVKFEIKNYGDYKDTNAVETAKLAGDFYGIKNVKVIYDFSADDLKKYLALGKPIIVPAAGQLLGNPFFTPPGPLYHNLVLTGYDGDEIITNDPGTKRGENYKYNINVLYNAIHDFPGNAADIEKGRKAMIVVE